MGRLQCKKSIHAIAKSNKPLEYYYYSVAFPRRFCFVDIAFVWERNGQRADNDAIVFCVRSDEWYETRFEVR